MKDIIRFYKTGKKKLVHFYVSEEQAREWCSSPFTKTNAYFDGFGNSGEYCKGQISIYNHYFVPDKDNH